MYRLLLAFLFVSCTAPEASRKIASNEEIEISSRFQSLDEVHEAYNDVLTLYSFAYEDLEQFDQSLESNQYTLFENPHYHKLIAARIKIEEINEALDVFIRLHFTQALDTNLPMEIRRESIERLRWVASFSHQDLNVLYRYIYSEELNKFSQDFLIELGKKSSDPLMKELDDFYVSLYQKYSVKAPNFKGMKKSLKENFKKYSKSKKWENHYRSIEVLGQELKLEFAKNIKNLNNPRFYPTAERAGNITGNEFPQKVWSLTFDDGPGASNSLKVMNNLKKNSLRATFFQVTKNAKSLSHVTKRLLDNGMEIACHSYGHRETPKLNINQRNYEIRTASQDLAQIAGRPMQFYRLPYGAGVGVADIRQRIANSNMIHVFWNVDTLDWMAQPPADIVARTIKQMRGTSKDAGVILFHDIHDRTVIASEEIMRFLNQDKRKVCLLEEIVGNMNRGLPACGN